MGKVVNQFLTANMAKAAWPNILIDKGYTRNMFTFILFYVIIFLVVGVKHIIQVTFGLQRCYLTPKEKSGPQPPAWHKLYSGGNILTAS